MARKYFGRELPIGGVLQVQSPDGRHHAMRVMAVLKDLPSNTNLRTEVFASGRSAYSYLNSLDARPINFANGALTYVRLSPAVTALDLQRALNLAGQPDLALAAQDNVGPAAPRISFHAQPRDEAHWAPPEGPDNPGARPSGSKAVTYAITAVAGLIVLVAAINFVTLMTARAARRAVEVGVRKATGATRRDLMVQFMGEALLQVAAAAVIAMALAEILIAPFDALVRRSLVVDFVHDPLLLTSVAGSALLIGLLAAIYPSLVLASFRPAAVLKSGIAKATGSPLARATLVALQFAVLVGLILTTTTIYRQTQFALSRGLGAADGKLIATVFAPCDRTFMAETRNLPGVSAAACSSTMPLIGKFVNQVRIRGRAEAFDVTPLDFGFFELYGVRPLAGRLFSRDHGEDALLDPKSKAQPSVVINETAARKLGFSNPRAAIGHSMTWTRSLTAEDDPVTGPSQIIGVVPDTSQTVRAAANPTFYLVTASNLNLVSVRLTGTDLAATLEAIKATWKRTGHAQPIDPVFLSQFWLNRYLDLRTQAEMMAICAGLAVLLSGLGLFALAAFMTERRTKEIGIRKAMGAETHDVVLLLLWQFTIPVLCAVTLALPIGLVAMTAWLAQFAYRVPLSGWTFVLAAIAAVATAWLTVSYQSFKVASAKPAGALRYE
jgi:putative ABC transport system permease protein